jgi:pyruvate/2-oxoglutarate dehydrogenase complex dihydrolipoamide acyltransferase (E2) component
MPFAFKNVPKTGDEEVDQEALAELEEKGWAVYDATGYADRYRLRKPYEEAPNVPATDAARQLAYSEGLDLRTVEPTGADGQVTKSDVEDALP